ncbi:chemotaxis protein CheX [Magnetococcales bacterium HHB-1]
MGERFIVAAKESVTEIAETMLFMEINAKESGPGRSELIGDASAVIGYSGALKGSMRLCGLTPAVLKLAGALLGEERDQLDMEMNDAFAEMANMIAGGIQTRVQDDLGEIKMSPPVIVSGRAHQVSSDHNFSCVNHTFELEGEPFFTEVFYLEESLKGKGDDVVDDGGASVGLPAMETSPGLDDQEKDEEPAAPVIEKQTLMSAVEEVFASQIAEITASAVEKEVEETLPKLAEDLVREEIERIKKEGL